MIYLNCGLPETNIHRDGRRGWSIFYIGKYYHRSKNFNFEIFHFTDFVSMNGDFELVGEIQKL